MKRTLIVALCLLALVSLPALGQPRDPEKNDDRNASTQPQEARPLPEPARDSGPFQRGGVDIGRGYGHAGREFGRGAAGFGKNFAHGEFGPAGRSFGRGAAEFGKGVGVGTGRGFKSFGLAFRNLGRKIDAFLSGDSAQKPERD